LVDKVRVGLIGCGFYAQNHLHSWQDLAPEGAVLTAVCDVDPAKAKAAGEEYGVAHYTDAAAMLDAHELDLVDIVTRRDTHRELAALTVSRGIATVVQKPFAPSWEDCIAIVDGAQKAGVWLAVHENFRFQTPMMKVRAAIDSGVIGTPSWGRISFRSGYDVYATQPYFYDEDRFAIDDVGIHVLDLARYFMGEVKRISCETQRRNPKVRAEDTATMMLRHTSGATSVVECTYEARRLPEAFPQTFLEIEGERGTLLVTYDFKMRIISDGGSKEVDIGSPLRPWTSDRWHVAQEGAFNACQHFLDCVKRGVPADTNGLDNLKSYALVDAAYLAAEEHRAVTPLSWP
jgi:predicted dehydrogenase